MFPFSNEEIQAKIAENNVKSIYAVRLSRKWRNGIESPWFALVIKSRSYWQEAILSSRVKPSDAVENVYKMLIDDTDSAISQFRGAEDLDLVLEDMSWPRETWPKDMAVLRGGRGFYETLVCSSLEGQI